MLRSGKLCKIDLWRLYRETNCKEDINCVKEQILNGNLKQGDLNEGLYLATLYNHEETAKLLIEHGADVKFVKIALSQYK